MKRGARGYTAVELMLALGLFAVGVSGIIAMQKVTIVSNSHAKNLSVATRVAEAWLDQLATDATLWDTTTGIDRTLWVVKAKDPTDGVWQLPVWDGERQFGPAFDALGAPTPDGDNARFCAHIRLTSLFDQACGLVGSRDFLAGNGLARAEVRVFWLRDGAAPIDGACSEAGTIDDVEGATDRYHQVVKVTAVRQHGTPK